MPTLTPTHTPSVFSPAILVDDDALRAIVVHNDPELQGSLEEVFWAQYRATRDETLRATLGASMMGAVIDVAELSGPDSRLLLHYLLKEVVEQALSLMREMHPSLPQEVDQEFFEYQPVPPRRSYKVPVRIERRGRAKPLRYELDNE